MNLQTKIPIIPQKPKIDYNSGVLLLGSCFAEHIGEKFEYYKFKTQVNPFGILFHPKAIETFLWMSTQGEEYSETDLFYHQEQWHCFDAHSSLSNADKNKVLSSLNSALSDTKGKISSATHMVITLGTAWMYRLKSLDMIVANCHKIPQKEFSKELMSVEEIVQCLENCIQLVRSQNPKISVIWTVSPVRHIKDGFIENNRSKSHLITAIHQCLELSDKQHYFPSYEIVMDELRDYRFYNEDMIHPNNTAVKCIWEYFKKAWVSEDTIHTMKRVEEIQKGLSHRPFNPDSKQHHTFLQHLENKKQKLQEEYPFLNF